MNLPQRKTSLRLRKMNRDDLLAVSQLESNVNLEPWSYQLFEGELALPPSSRHWLVAIDPDGEIVAFGGVMYAASTAHLMNLGVRRSWRRQGLATMLCAVLFIEARGRGALDLTLEVRASNSGAAALYEHLQMEAAGTRPGYYQDGEDAVIFWIHDLQADTVGSQLEALAAS